MSSVDFGLKPNPTAPLCGTGKTGPLPSGALNSESRGEQSQVSQLLEHSETLLLLNSLGQKDKLSTKELTLSVSVFIFSLGEKHRKVWKNSGKKKHSIA